MKFFFRLLIGIGLKLLIILHFDFLREPHSAVHENSRLKAGCQTVEKLPEPSKHDLFHKRVFL